MKTNLFILALVALLGGTPVLAENDRGGGDVGSNGQGTGKDEVRGDVGGNGQGTGKDEVRGDVGGNGQGTGKDEVRGDVGGNGQGTDKDEVRGDVGGNGMDVGDVSEGDVGGNGQGNGDVGGNGQGSDSGTEFLNVRDLQFYSTAVQLVKNGTTKGDVRYASSRLLEILPYVTVKATKSASRLKRSTDAHGAILLETHRNQLVVNETLFAALSSEEKANVLTHHLSQVAGIIEETVSAEIAASVR